jgi:hypothetical protein
MDGSARPRFLFEAAEEQGRTGHRPRRGAARLRRGKALCVTGRLACRLGS